VTLEDQSRPGRGGSETSTDGVAPILEPTADIQAVYPLYLVLLVSRNGKWLRKPYLSLHSAQAALHRAEERGQNAALVLCRLTPITADLGIDGEVSA
jgi:hypothetical protein